MVIGLTWAVVFSCGGPPDENVSMYLGSPGRTSDYDTQPAIKGEVKWAFQANPWTTSSPVIDHGVVYFGSGVYLIAVDATTGEELWRFETGDPVRSSPAVSDGVVFIGSHDGHLYALDAKKGQELWKFKTGDRVVSSPVVSNGLVLVGSRDAHMYALDAPTGAERWRFQTGKDIPVRSPIKSEELWNNLITGIRTSPAVSDRTVVFGASDGKYYALDLETGQERWAFKTAGPAIFTTAPIGDGVVYVPEGDPLGRGGVASLLALDLETGDEIWRFDLGSDLWVNGVAVSEGVAYVGLKDRSDKIHVAAIDVETTRELWRHKVGPGDIVFYKDGARRDPLVVGIPAVASNVVYIGNTRFNLHALSIDTGNEIWDIETSQVRSSPTVADGTLYFTSVDGFLYAVE